MAEQRINIVVERDWGRVEPTLAYEGVLHTDVRDAVEIAHAAAQAAIEAL